MRDEYIRCLTQQLCSLGVVDVSSCTEDGATIALQANELYLIFCDADGVEVCSADLQSLLRPNDGISPTHAALVLRKFITDRELKYNVD